MAGSDEDKKKGFNAMFLGNLKSRAGKETVNWLSDLTEEENDGSVEDMVEQASVSQASQAALPAQFAHPSIAQTQVKWVDKLFDLFQQYEVEFNRVVQSAQLRVETDRAVISSDLIARMQGSDHHYYSGRLYTRLWTLVIRGNLSHIEGYVIPSDHYIGFEHNVDKYTKFFEFIPLWDGDLKWGFERVTISLDQLPSVAKRIFGQLVRVAKGEAGEDEQLSLGASPASAHSNNPASPGVYGGHSSSEVPEYLLKHGGVFEDSPPPAMEKAEAAQASESSQARPGRSGRATSKMQAVQNNSANASSESSQKANKASSQQALPQEPASELNAEQRDSQRVRQAEAPSSQVQDQQKSGKQVMTQAQNPASSNTAFDPSQVTLAQAFEILARALENELNVLSKAGAKAFETHDFGQVELLMKRTAKLKSMRDQMSSTISEWKRALQNPD